MVEFQLVDASTVLPEGVESLAEEAERFGIGNMRTLINRWVDGTERYDGTGEAIIGAVADGEVVGIGGISKCPDVEGALRVRRFYVADQWRRGGVAQAIAERVIAAGFEHADTLTCNARASDAAPKFWERIGFEPTAIEGITHLRRRASISEITKFALGASNPN